MSKLIFVLPLVAALSGCVSEEARRVYEEARASLALLQEQIAADKVSTGRENQQLISQLKDAESRVESAKSAMASSRIDTTASAASSWLVAIGPIVGVLFPPAMAILGPIQGALSGFIASRKKVGLWQTT